MHATARHPRRKLPPRPTRAPGYAAVATPPESSDLAREVSLVELVTDITRAILQRESIPLERAPWIIREVELQLRLTVLAGAAEPVVRVLRRTA